MAEPTDRLYSRSHEWALIKDGSATVGITSYAQDQLGDVVFVELPPVGRKVARGEAIGTIESVKAVSDLYSPLDGEVSEVNRELESHPELINQDPYAAGWIVRMAVAPGAEAGLMDAAAYEQFVAEEGAH